MSDDLKITITPVKPISKELRPCSAGGHIFHVQARTEPGIWPCLRGCGAVMEKKA